MFAKTCAQLYHKKIISATKERKDCSKEHKRIYDWVSFVFFVFFEQSLCSFEAKFISKPTPAFFML